MLPHASLDPSHLITLDEVPLPPLELPTASKNLFDQSRAEASSQPSRPYLCPQNTRLILVDHNGLDGRLASYFADPPLDFRPSVAGCVDHHVDEHQVPLDTGEEPRIIQTCGSCTSLVLNHLRTAWDGLSAAARGSGAANAQTGDAIGVDDSAVRQTWDAQVAKLALASILVDTRCLKDPGKVTDADRRAVDFLEAKIHLAPISRGKAYDRESFFEEITAAKSNLDALSVGEVLRKDFKTWNIEPRHGAGPVHDETSKKNVKEQQELGVSCVVKPLHWLAAKTCVEGNEEAGISALREQVKQFGQERNVTVQAVMTASTSSQGDFQRELLLLAVDKSSAKVLKDFEAQAKEELGLEDWHEVALGSEAGCMRIWWQMNVSKSRKQVGPLLRNVMGS